jgi:hypothetical protein
MRYFAVCTSLALVLVCLSSAFAQAAPGLRVCVAGLQEAGGGVAPTASRDALVKFLGKQKNVQLEALPLDAAVPNEALAEAKEKKCGYVVTTRLAELHSDSGYTSGFSGVNMQTFYVTVDYKPNKVSDAAEESGGSFKASDRGSPQNATVATMKKIADKVADSIKKGGALAK